MTEPQHRAEEWQAMRDRQDRAARLVAITFVIAIVASVALLVVYVQGGDTQWEGALLAIAFGAVGLGLGIWVRRIVGPQVVVEEREGMTSDDEHRQAFEQIYHEALGEARVGGRRRFLIRLLAGAGGTLGLALLVPLRSLGPGPEDELFRTAWRRGVRLVDAEGEPIKADAIVEDQVITVFPEGAKDVADAQAVVIGARSLEPSALPQPDGVVDATVCYSKICTHAGCPVGLYRASEGELLCPCHQSTFDVNHGARVKSGPAGRPLPQLPIGVDGDGYLVALSDFSSPVGPSFWNLTHDRGGDA
jgi:ubiquinol-cytochrome c reductase iron-sulfur subunit